MRRRCAHTLSGILVVFSAAACRPSAHERPHVVLSNIDPLRSAFNADSGKVRAIFLASPT